ncbi:MAG: DEAD/DEAH box helicase family protein [Tepidisphaeraceae bacterium]
MNKPTHLIINNPYAMPRRYWKYDRQRQSFDLAEGRRPAGYTMATPGQTNTNDPGVFVEIELVNRIRPRVDAWREAGYPGVTATTRTLLEHWNDIEQREPSKRFFFCQLEAMETLIWLTEAPAAERVGIDIPGDGGPFRRLCSKMATGSGKTIVMAMLIAWQVLNKAANNQDPRYSKNVLLIAPGLTVRKRLEVLKPEGPDNYFDLFKIVPDSLMQALRSHGRIRIINWHKLAWESEAKLAKKKGVDKRGARSDDAWLRDVLDDMAKARSLVVINDEAHHAWRIPAGVTLKGISREDKEEATKWIGGLDRIHKARTILTCFDLSATPFVPGGRQESEDALFRWIVSDFGLTDAIESGLVKTPRVVIRDDALPDAATYKSKLYHIYAATDQNGNRIRDDLNRDAEPQEALPQLVLNAYYLLGKDWLDWKARWAEAKHPVPPVMMTVVNRIETAARIKHAIDHGDILLPELCDSKRTLQIDSDALGKAEAQEEAIAISDNGAGDGEGGGDDNGDDAGDGPVRKLTKAQQSELMRRMVDTVGKPGEPGAHIQHVISVAMLSEGWDAKTVTHIMGLRAFTSQLLCEQVVGRGLRRTNYDIEQSPIGAEDEPAAGKKQGKGAGTLELPFQFKPEYVNVFGVPFTFMPHEETGEPPPPPPPTIRVEALPERAEAMQISWPQVIRIEHVLTPQLTVDWAKVSVLEIDAAHIAQLAELAPTVDGKADTTKVTEIQLRDLAEKFRYQKLIFETARKLFEEETPAWRGSPDFLLGQLIGLVETFLHSDRVSITPNLFAQSDLHRRVLLALSMSRIVQHLKIAIREGNTQSRQLVLDENWPIRSTGDMRPWFTSRPCEPTKRSHISHCVYDSTWEAAEAHWLDHADTADRVAAWARNDHLGFEIRYIFAGGVSKYRPDFLIRLRNRRVLVLEVKGEDKPRDLAKRAALTEWVEAVNADGRYGQWCRDVSYSASDVLDILTKHARPVGASGA